MVPLSPRSALFEEVHELLLRERRARSLTPSEDHRADLGRADVGKQVADAHQDPEELVDLGLLAHVSEVAPQMVGGRQAVLGECLGKSERGAGDLSVARTAEALSRGGNGEQPSLGDGLTALGTQA